MMTDLVLAPKHKRTAAQTACCAPLAVPGVDVHAAAALARVAKALGDPVRVQLLDLLGAHAGEVCVCDIAPNFRIGQSTLSHHLKVLREAGLVDSVKRGLWAYYFVVPGALDPIVTWLGAQVAAPPTTNPTPKGS